MTTAPERPSRWGDRITAGIERLRATGRSRRVQVVALAVLLPLFVAGVIASWRATSIRLDQLALVPLLAAAAAVPLAVGASTWQLRTLARALGAPVRWRSALRAVVLGTLSSVLPVSSGTVVRAGAVVYWGASPADAARGMAFDAVLWLGASLLYAGGAALLIGATGAGAAMAGAGALLLPASALVAGRLVGARDRAELAAARAAGILIDVLRLQACFLALGVPVRFLEASVLAAASPLAAALFFLPGSIGVREGFVAAVGLAAGIGPGAAFLAATLNRLLDLTVLLLWEGAGLLGRGRTGDRGGGSGPGGPGERGVG